MIGIYKIMNTQNNKVYIGSSIDIQRRLSQHKAMIGSGTNQMYLDMQKQGLSTFKFEIIEECSKEQLKEKEKYWIEYYDSYNKGYNLTKDGRGDIKYIQQYYSFKDYKNLKLDKILPKQGVYIIKFPNNKFYFNYSSSNKGIKSDILSDFYYIKQGEGKIYSKINLELTDWGKRKAINLNTILSNKITIYVKYCNTQAAAHNLFKKEISNMKDSIEGHCCYNITANKIPFILEQPNLVTVNYDEILPLNGVYQLLFNDGKSYIGSSGQINNRVLSHIKDIVNNKNDWHSYEHEREGNGASYVIQKMKIRVQYTNTEEEARLLEKEILSQIYNNHCEDNYYNTVFYTKDQNGYKEFHIKR